MERPAKKRRLDRSRNTSPPASRTSGEYVYKPLSNSDTVRLLQLLPAGSQDQPLRANLLQADLVQQSPGDKSAQSYEALSYTWGDLDLKDVLLIEGRTVPIRRNLRDALQRFRLKERPRFLWVDAICINQADPDERTAQVTLMHEIYREAERTLSFLGQDSASADGRKAIAFFAWLNSSLRSRQSLEKMSNAKALDMTIRRYNRKVAADLQISTSTILAFCERPYFTRRWIVQEVGIARKVQFWCGESNIDGNFLARAASLLLFDGSPIPIEKPFMRLMSLLSPAMYLAGGKTTTKPAVQDAQAIRSLGALERFQDFGCGDDRDRIAALKSVASPASSIVVDYTSTVEDVYTLFARDIVVRDIPCYGGRDTVRALRSGLPVPQRRSDSTVCLLSSAARRSFMRGPNSIATMPPWVPDWRVAPQQSNCKFGVYKRHARKSGAVTIRLLREVEQSSIIVRLEGKRIIKPKALLLDLINFEDLRMSVNQDNDDRLRNGDCVVDFYEDGPYQTRFDLYGEVRSIVLRPKHEHAEWDIIGAVDYVLTNEPVKKQVLVTERLRIL